MNAPSLDANTDGTRVRWGILGTGSIAAKLTEAIARVPGTDVVAVGSRTDAAAAAFAARFGIGRAHGSYHALCADPEVDVVYVATPHTLHHENTLMALDAGRAVLCEKPFTINHKQTVDLVARARARGLFLMEAVWTRCFPLMRALRKLIDDGTLGALRTLHADFGFRKDGPDHAAATGRLFDPRLGGGALLDVGVYPVSLASWAFGAPTRVAALARKGPTGVDEDTGIVLGHADGGLAILSCGIRTETSWEATLSGDRARVRIHRPFWHPHAMTISRPGQVDETLSFPEAGNGYEHEVVEVVRCLRAGALESPLVPLDESLSVMKTLDQIRAAIDLRYPGE